MTIGVFIQHATPFLAEFFECIHNLDYPRERISIFIHNLVDHHDATIQAWADQFGVGHYANFTVLPKQTEEWQIRTEIMYKYFAFIFTTTS